MHHIHLAEGMRLRFPARNADFDQGVEIGIVAALMSQDLTEFTRKISNDNLGQVRALVEQFGYRLVDRLSPFDLLYGRADGNAG